MSVLKRFSEFTWEPGCVYNVETQPGTKATGNAVVTVTSEGEQNEEADECVSPDSSRSG